MTNKEAIAIFYGKALTVNIKTASTEALIPILEDDFVSTGSVDSKHKK